MSMQSTARDQTASQNPQQGAATIRFRRDQVSSGVSRLGRLRHGGLLRIEYDPLRLCNDSQPYDIVSHVRFEPSEGQSKVLQLPVSAVQAPSARPRLATHEITIPDDASLVELWFERRTPT